MRELFLKSEDLQTLKEIGSGTEGKVYQYTNQLLIKLYYNKIYNIDCKEFKNFKTNASDTKIYQKGTNFNNPYTENIIIYYQEEQNDKMILYPLDGLQMAIQKNENIKWTTLPIGIVYIDNHFAGSLLQKQFGIQIHKLIGLPLNIRKKIYYHILRAEYELFNNYIYHCDLSNSPFVQKIVNINGEEQLVYGHSHVLVNPITLQTHFIDLDGKSTIYTTKEDQFFLQKSLVELTKLTIEFLLQIDWEEYKDNSEEMVFELEQKGINSPLIQQKIYECNMNIEELYELCRTLKK